MILVYCVYMKTYLGAEGDTSNGTGAIH